MTEQQCIAAETKGISNILQFFERQQQKAVFSVNGPVLVLGRRRERQNNGNHQPHC